MLVRNQFLVPAALDRKIPAAGTKEGICQSALVVVAVEALLGRSRRAASPGAWGNDSTGLLDLMPLA